MWPERARTAGTAGGVFTRNRHERARSRILSGEFTGAKSMLRLQCMHAKQDVIVFRTSLWRSYSNRKGLYTGLPCGTGHLQET